MSEEAQSKNNGYIANTPQVPYVLYDIGLKLSENLENIKELRDYQIVKFGLDSNNNQWFLYKPRDSENITTAGGQLWVRMNNFPFAYPVSYNTRSANDEWQNNNELNNTRASQVIDFDINNNFGIIRTSNYIITFDTDGYILDDESIEVVLSTTTKKIARYNKLINVNTRSIYKMNNNQRIIGYVFLNNKYYVFYFNSGSGNILNYKIIENEEIVQYNYEISSDGTVILPQNNSISLYSDMSGVVNVFKSQNNVNIVMECPSNV